MSRNPMGIDKSPRERPSKYPIACMHYKLMLCSCSTGGPIRISNSWYSGVCPDASVVHKFCVEMHHCAGVPAAERYNRSASSLMRASRKRSSFFKRCAMLSKPQTITLLVACALVSISFGNSEALDLMGNDARTLHNVGPSKKFRSMI